MACWDFWETFDFWIKGWFLEAPLSFAKEEETVKLPKAFYY